MRYADGVGQEDPARCFSFERNNGAVPIVGDARLALGEDCGRPETWQCRATLDPARS